MDQAHKQNNACVKGDVDAVGLTDNPSELRRWMVAGPEVARVTGKFESSALWGCEKVNTNHHDQTANMQTSFVRDFTFWLLSLQNWETHLKRRARICLFLIPRKSQILL